MFKKLATFSCAVLISGLTVAQQPDLSPAPAASQPDQSVIHVDPWTAQKVQHAYGLPDTKPKVTGTILVNNAGLTFTSNASRYTIPWSDTVAVSNGVERVEMWGTTGRIVRMVIPNGGGLMAAGVMHHKVNELTVEFHDPHGAYHGAVFLLPGNDATHLLDVYTHAVVPAHAAPSERSQHAPTCQGTTAARSVLIAPPSWNQSDVPVAYRAMVYEHIVDRITRVEGAGHVYRDGETEPQPMCPQYTIAVSVVSFKPGNQVQRAMTGPVGFFAGTTQMVFNVTIQDASGKLNKTEQIKATVRGEGESKNITDGVAKKIAKSYANTVKQYQTTTQAAGGSAPPPH